MAQFRYEVWPVPGIGGTYEKKIAALRPDSASGTLYRRQSGQGQLSIPANYDRLDEIITVDPSNHGNDVASLIRVYRGSDLIQELLVPVSPNLVADQPATLSCNGVEAVMDWAIVECWDWDGSADFTSTVPDWIYGGRNLIPDIALGDLGSIREEWEAYLSGERYDFDVVGSGGVYNFTVDGNTTSDIAWDASRSTIKSALEALAGVTEVSVIQADPDTLSFIIVFEDPKDLSADMTKGGAAATTLTKLNDGFDPSTNPTFTLTVDGQTTSALDWDATAKQVEGSPLGAQPGLEGLSNVNDVTVSGEGISSDPWSVTFYDPPDPTNFTATFAAGTAVLTKIVEGDVDPSPVTVSQSADASRNPTTHGTYADPPIQVVTTPLDTAADWSLLVNATGQYAGSQIILNGVTPGQIYQASINVRPTVTGLYTLVIRDQFENLIATTTPRDNLLTAGSFQELSITDVEIPEGVTRIIMRVAVTDPTSSNWADFYVNWQGAEFREGQAATTAGQVLLDLLADAQTDHASGGFPRDTIDFINASFDATNDTASAAWADAELSINIPRGMTYRKVLDRVFGQLGYEWNLTPTTGTPGEWDLNVWNPDGRGTDHSAADTPSLLLGQRTLGGSATRQVPQANRIISEGAGQFTTRARNTASEGTIGSREWYQADVSYRGAQTEEWTDKTLARFLDVSLQPRFEIADPPDTEWPIPVVDYDLADILNVDLANGAGKVSRTVEAISWRTVSDGIRWGVHTGEAQFDAFPGGGSVGGLLGGTGGGDDGRGAVAVAPQRQSLALSGPVDEGVRRLLDEFDRQQFQPTASAFTPGRGGGVPTVLVAASNASEISQGKADIIAGDDATEAILEAIGMLPTSPTEKGRIVLSEGDFIIGVSQSTDIFDVGSNRHIQGMGRLGTRILVAADGTTTGRVLFELGDGSLLSDLTIERDPSHTLGLNSYVAVGLFGTRCGLRDMDIIQVGSRSGSAPCSVWAFSTNQGYLDNVYLSAPEVGVIMNQALNMDIKGSWFPEGTGALQIDNTGATRISNCRFDTDDGIRIGSLSDGIIIEGCGFFNATTDSILCESTNVTIVGNDIEYGERNNIRIVPTADENPTGRIVIADNVLFAAGQEQIYIEEADPTNDHSHVSITGNLLLGSGEGATAIEGAGTNALSTCHIADNEVWRAGGHGIELSGYRTPTVANNTIHDPGRTTDNTYDGINVSTDEAMVTANTIRPDSVNATRYAINVASGTGNIVVGNDYGDASDYGTAAYNDSGTSTVNTYPNDATLGDNFAT